MIILNMIRRSAVEALVEILSLDVLAALRPVRVVRGILRYQSIKWSFECLRQRPFTVVREMSLNRFGSVIVPWF